MDKATLSKYITPTDRQKFAFQFIGKGARIYYGGARGGGKSHFCLITALLIALAYPGISIVMLRRTYGELQDYFITRLKANYPDTVFGYKYIEKTKTATFTNGSKIILRACDNEKDAQKIQGIEYQLMIIDEANNFDEMTIHRLSGSLRNSKVKNFEPTLLMTGNPGGLSDLYFINHFVNPDFKKWLKYELDYQDKYIFVPAKVYDNPHINESYTSWLMGLPEDLKRAWLDGDFTVFEGQFFNNWIHEKHVVGEFEIPPEWLRVVGIDLGYTKKHPTVALFAAQDPKTQRVYIYREYAGTGSIEEYIREIQYFIGDENVAWIFADPSMFRSSTKFRDNDESPDMMFLQAGLMLTPANNDRINGWRIVKQWLHHDEHHPPMLQIMDCCPNLIETLPLLRFVGEKLASSRTQKKEDLDTRQRDDAADALRYLLVSGFGYPVGIVYDLETDKFIYKDIDTPLNNDYELELFVSERSYF
jgi:phage terminase large subunit